MASGQNAGELPPVAQAVDAALCVLDDQLDWLTALSPLHSHLLWQDFVDSGSRRFPALEYPPADSRLPQLRRELLNLPVEEVEQETLRALLWEKQHELDQKIELMRLRDTPGFLLASMELWGAAEPDLVHAAEALLKAVARHRPSGAIVGCEVVRAEAERQRDQYRARDARFASEIIVDEDLTSKLMVSHGHLHIAADIQVEQVQVAPLIHHEMGTHALTRHNGSLQPLSLLKCGLGHYDTLQEGLAVLSEYLSGYLSPARLSVLAARVLATRRLCDGADPASIVHELAQRHDFDPYDAFAVTLRVLRSGGMTKDVIYLRGLRALLEYLREGGSLEFLFTGKFALTHLRPLQRLRDEGLVHAPVLLPLFFDSETAQARLERCRSLSLAELATEDLAA